MSEPLDHQIVVEVSRLLRRIRVANGFRTDAGEQVLDEDNHAEIDETKVVLEVLDDDEEADYQNCKRRRASLQLTIAVFYPAGDVDQALRRDARRVLADIRQALGDPSQHQFPTGAVGLELGGRTMFIREAGSRVFRPELRARVTFHENHRSNS